LLPQFPANALVHRAELLSYVTSDRIRSNAQLDGALEYLGKVRSGARRTMNADGLCGSVARLATLPGGLGCRHAAGPPLCAGLHMLLPALVKLSEPRCC
jgi:hypothetical protein